MLHQTVADELCQQLLGLGLGQHPVEELQPQRTFRLRIVHVR